MMVSATSEVVRIMGVWVRRADAGLARGAARNAATSMADLAARRFEEARALRDLEAALPGAGRPVATDSPAPTTDSGAQAQAQAQAG